MAAPSGRTPRLALPYPTPDDDVDVPRDQKALADRLDAGATYIVGEIRWLPILAVPFGFLLADGRALDRTAYAALFAAYGVTHGSGDGSTTFNIPDLRGRVAVGAGQGPGLTLRAIGTQWGVEAVLLTDPRQNASHGHGNTGVTNIDHTHGPYQAGGFLYTNYGVGDGGDAGAQPYWAADGPASAQTGGMQSNVAHAHTTAASGGGMAHENMQPSIALPAYVYAGA